MEYHETETLGEVVARACLPDEPVLVNREMIDAWESRDFLRLFRAVNLGKIHRQYTRDMLDAQVKYDPSYSQVILKMEPDDAGTGRGDGGSNKG